MSYFSDSLGDYEAARDAGHFARVVETIDGQNNPASALILRALTRAAELGDLPEVRINEMVDNIAGLVLAQEDIIEPHSWQDNTERVGIGGVELPFLPGWKLHVDFYAEGTEWPLASLDYVDKVEFMLRPYIEDDGVYPPTNDILCDAAQTVTFVLGGNSGQRWTYDRLNSELELATQAEVLDFLNGLSEGITTP